MSQRVQLLISSEWTTLNVSAMSVLRCRETFRLPCYKARELSFERRVCEDYGSSKRRIWQVEPRSRTTSIRNRTECVCVCVSVRLSGRTSEGLTHKELQGYVVHQDVIQGNDAQLPKVGGQLQCIHFLFGPKTKNKNRQGFRSKHTEEGRKRFHIYIWGTQGWN